jgi:hypothetical protein
MFGREEGQASGLAVFRCHFGLIGYTKSQRDPRGNSRHFGDVDEENPEEVATPCHKECFSLYTGGRYCYG